MANPCMQWIKGWLSSDCGSQTKENQARSQGDAVILKCWEFQNRSFDSKTAIIYAANKISGNLAGSDFKIRCPKAYILYAPAIPVQTEKRSLELITSGSKRKIILLKRIFIVLAIALSHLILTKIILWITAESITANTFEKQLSYIPDMLVFTTKILSFPIISLTLYPRHWYPGNLIVIPFFFNSLIWALLIYGGIILVKRFCHQK